MKTLKLTLLTALGALALSAQTSNPNIQTYAAFPAICEVNPSFFACGGFKPGGEQYYLMVKALGATTTEYHYSVLATIAGKQVVFKDVVARQDDVRGFTWILIPTGGLVTAWTVQVKEYSVTGQQSAVVVQ